MTISSRQHRRRLKRTVVIAAIGGVMTLACLLVIGGLIQQPEGTIAALLLPTSTSIPTPALTPAPTRTPTSTPTPTPTLTPTPEVVEAQDHYLLARPLSQQGNNEPTPFYRYGSTAGGRYRVHRGVDFPNPSGTQILASAKGRVIVAGADDRTVYGERLGFYGKLVIIQLEHQYRGQKVYVLYGHLSQIQVRFLQKVDEGEIIGQVGMSGVAIGPHLHLEVRVGENSYQNTRNPELWLRGLPGKGTIAGRLVDSEGRPLSEQSITFYRQETPDRRWQDVATYSEDGANSDEEWAENFALGDVPTGDYLAKTYVNGRLFTAEVEVTEGKTSFVTIEAG